MTTTAIDARLNEQALRRQDFRGGEPITLADGQDWAFPKPCVIYRPKFGGKLVSGLRTTDLGPDFDVAIAEAEATARGGEGEGDQGRNFFDAILNLAVVMLTVNYDLTDQQYCELLAYKVGDFETDDRWSSIIDVARGIGKKQMHDSTKQHS